MTDEAHPKTLPEWRAYFDTLSGEVLREKAIAANTPAFIHTLKEEGYPAPEIHSILIALARRFDADGQRPPGEGLYDLDVLRASEPPVP